MCQHFLYVNQISKGMFCLQGEVLDLCKPTRVICDRIKADQEIVLSGVVALHLVVVHEAIEAGVGKSLVVVTPADTLVV